VQVFRFVTEHTVEEKIVERAQQKLKLDAMVVQQGRLKDKDGKLGRDELLAAVRFGADKIFKSKDSSITDEDIELILEAGKRKTGELNEKLQAADKGDLLDFKFDGGNNLQTFEGVNYSGHALAQAKADAELMGILDVGKRERRTVTNYNESKLYQEQLAGIQGTKVKEKKKKKAIRLPKELRLPRMEEWQMFDRTRLLVIQEEEEKNFRALPEEVQKMGTMKMQDSPEQQDGPEQQEGAVNNAADAAKELETKQDPVEPTKLPPLLSEEVQEEKKLLLSEGFANWSRVHYSVFIKASTRFGRSNLAKIALEVGKSETEVEDYAKAFWGNFGKQRISEHEYDRVVKLIEKGEKKIDEIKALERGTRVLISLFDNPWEELEFTHVPTKDKLFSADNDRYLLCWTHKVSTI
jgi:SWI/SNF-related matrix-associated actin-dependent regulator of chromatin subfamily A member 5